MGQEVCKAVDAAGDLELVAMIDQGDWLYGAADAGAQVLVDFTTPDVVMDNLHWAIDQGINMVVGTTGFTDQRLDRVRGWLSHKPEVGALIAPNFGLGAVLMMQFAQKAARYFESAEIIEQHHPRKLDAPSGTATHTARLIAAARAEAGCGPMPDATKEEQPGARGADIEGVRVHAVRAAGLVAHRRFCSVRPARR
jgi:4-hydroxy-tetrahydrodipicolinate reductase